MKKKLQLLFIMILAVFMLPLIGYSQITSFPYSEGFENSGSIPSGWTNDASDAGGDWQFETSNSHGPNSDHSGSGYYALLDDYNISSSNSPFYMLSPTFDLSTAGKSYQISYWYWIGSDGATNPIIVEASSDGGSNWTTIYTHDQTTTGVWTKNTIDLSSYSTATVVIRFKGTSDYGYGTDNSGIDDFVVEEIPSCPPPTNAMVTNLTSTGAQLNWTTGGATNFVVEYGPAGFTQGTGTYVSIATDTFKVLTGLSAGTSYDWYVKDSCGAADVSTWLGPNNFITAFGPHAYPLTEDFESGFSNFGNAPGNNQDFSIETSIVHSGSQSVHNAYGANSENILYETGILDLSGASYPIIEFWQIAKTEGGWDKCYIEVSTDGGSTYNAIDDSLYMGNSANYAAKGYFHEDSYSEWGTGSETPDNSWWKKEKFDLTPFKTTNVQFRFRITGDGSAQRNGWYLDDIAIQEQPANEVEVSEVLGDFGGFDVSGVDTVTVIVKNNGVLAQTNIPMKYTLDNGTVVSETMPSLAAFSTDTFTFATTFDATAVGNHLLMVYSALSGDEDNTNDTLVKSFITNAVTTVPSLFDFPNTTDVNFQLIDKDQSSAEISIQADNGGGNGIKLTGGISSSGWSGSSSSTDVTAAFNNDSHIAKASMEVDATGITNVFMDFDLKMTYTYGKGYSWLRVMINDSVYAKTLNGDSVWNPNTKDGDDWRTVTLNLSDYAGTIYKLSFESAMKYANASSSNDKALIDNIKLYEPPANEVAVIEIIRDYGGFNVPSNDTVTVLVSNKGTSLQTAIPINFKLDNGTVVSETMPSLAAFSTDTFTFATTFDATAVGPHSLMVYTSLSGDENTANDTMTKAFVTYGTHTIPYTDDFESGYTYFENASSNINNFSLENTIFHSGSQAVHDAYAANSDDVLHETGVMDLTSSTTPVLDFWHIAITENNYDEALVEISTDNGATWSIIDDSLYLGDGAYTNEFYANSYSNWGYGAVDNSKWRMERFNLEAFKDDSIRVRFRLDADGSVQKEGWYIDDITIQEEPAAIANLGNDTAICDGSSITLNCSQTGAGYSYLWTFNGVDTLAATTSSIVTDSAGTYAVQVTGIATVAYDTIVISVNPLPTVAVSILGNDTICYGDSTQVSLNFTGASPWTFDIVDGSNMFTDSSLVSPYQPYADPDTTKSYTVVNIVDGNGCYQNIFSDTITITVNSLPTVAMSTLSDVCEDANVFTITGGSPANGTYTGIGVNTTASTFDAATAGSGNHNITYHYTDANGCTDSASTIQKVNALPMINATAGVNPVPYNTTTTLDAAVSNAVGTLSYSWTPTASINGSATAQSVNTVNIVSATNFVVSIIDAGTSCQNTDTVALTYSGGPISVNPISVPTSICIGDSAALQSQASGGNGTITYSWTSIPAGFTSTDANPYVKPTLNTKYIVVATDGANTATDTVEVTMLATPTVSYILDSTAVCLGQSTNAIVNFTGQAPFSYTYNGIIKSNINATSDTVTVSPTADITYNITSITDGNNCSDNGSLDNMFIKVNSIPTVSASDDDTICNGDSAMITLNFTGAAPWSYNVFDGNSTHTLIANNATTVVYPDPSVSTNYILTSITDNNGCVASGNMDSVYIMVNALPTVVASDNDSICFADSAQIILTFTGAAPYTFSVDTGSTVFNDNSATNTYSSYACPDATTNYVIVNITDANGCSVSGRIDSVEILVHALPAKPSFTGLNAAYCVDASDAILVPNPLGGTFSGTGVSGNFFSPSTAGVGSHDVVYTVTDMYNCSNGDTMSTVVNGLPVVQLSGLSSAYCVDAPDAQLSGTPTGGTFIGTGLTSSDEFSPSVAGAGTYTIKYTYTDGNSCTNVDSAMTTVNALPVIAMPTLNPVCVDAASFALTGATPAGGNWTGNGVSNNNFNAASAGAGSHYLTYTYTDANTCTNFDSTSIMVNALPVLTVTGLNPEYCLDAAAATMVATPSGGTFYGPGVSGASFDPAVAGVGQFNLLYFYTDPNGCFNSTNITTVVNALPVVNLGADTTICAVNNTTLDAGTFVSYLWNTGDTTQIITVDSTGYGIGAFSYSVVVTDMNTCTNTDSVVVTYEASPVSQLSDSAEICGEDQSIFLDAGYVSGNYYVWDNGVAWSSVTIDTSDINGTTGYMGVTINSPIGCITHDSTYVYFKEVPVVNLGNDTTICWTQNITFDAGAGFSSYLWNTGATTQTLSVDSFDFVVGLNTYSVEVTNSVNCSASDSVDLMIDPCTGVLTPVLKTADINVYPNPTKGQFQIDINGLENADYDLSIYNSLGSKVFGGSVNYNGQSTQSWKIDFSTYPKGIYFIRLQSEGQIKVKRIIIQ